MNRLAACLVLGIVTAAAQAPVALAQPRPGVVVEDYDLAPEEEVVVREYVVRRPPSPRVIFREDLTLRPGSVVPGYVELLPLEGGRRPLGSFVSPDDKIVIVDLGSRRVVRILDR